MSPQDESQHQNGSPAGAPPSFGSAPPSAPATPPPVTPPPVTPPPIPTSGPAEPRPEPKPAPTPTPEPQAEQPNVGWYPSPQSGYSPAAGPFAAANPYAPKAAKAGLAGRRTRTWGGSRGPLLNLTLFGVAPLALAGIVVAAFVLAAPGKGGQASAHAGFTAGAGPTAGQQQPQGSGSTAPGQLAPSQGSTSTRPGKRSSMPTGHPRISDSPSASSGQQGGGGGPAPKPRTSKKPRPKGSGRVTPQDLGVPNFAGYCAHIGQGTAVEVTSKATGWHCSANTGLTLSVQGACAYTYNLSVSKVINVSTNFNDANAWQCWRTNGILGQLNITTYCADSGQGAAKLSASNAYGWTCAGAAIDTTAACQLMYHNNTAFSRFAVFQDPYSWQCWD